MQVPKRRMEQFIVRDTGPYYVTQEGFERLKRSLARVEQSFPELRSEVQRTKAFGDFSENAEYTVAKQMLRRALGREAMLRDRIARAVIIDPQGQGSGVVQIGSTVVVACKGKQSTFQIVGSYETDPAKGRISHTSPLGSALLNHRVGDRVMVTVPSGQMEYEIIEIMHV